MKGKGKNSERKRALKWSIARAGMAVLLVSIPIVLTFLAVTPVMAQEAGVTVTVNAPEYVEEGDTFDVTIDVDYIEDFNAGQFDLSFDPSVVKTKEKDVTVGRIDGTEIPITMCGLVDSDTIKIMPGLSGETTVSGTGYLAKIMFEVIGKEGDECVLELSNGELVKLVKTAEEALVEEEILAEWIDDEIRVGVEEEDEEEDEEAEDIGEEVTPGSPNITAWKPAEAVISNTAGQSRTFNISIDQITDISWQINGTEVQTNGSVTEAAYTNTSAVIGTWNVSAIATNTTTGLSDTHMWIWSVTLTATVTPTPTLAPEVTPAPEAEAEGTPTPKPTATPTTEGNPTPTPTPKPAVPGFEAIFAIAVMPAIAYILLRWR